MTVTVPIAPPRGIGFLALFHSLFRIVAVVGWAFEVSLAVPDCHDYGRPGGIRVTDSVEAPAYGAAIDVEFVGEGIWVAAYAAGIDRFVFPGPGRMAFDQTLDTTPFVVDGLGQTGGYLIASGRDGDDAALLVIDPHPPFSVVATLPLPLTNVGSMTVVGSTAVILGSADRLGVVASVDLSSPLVPETIGSVTASINPLGTVVSNGAWALAPHLIHPDQLLFRLDPDRGPVGLGASEITRPQTWTGDLLYTEDRIWDTTNALEPRLVGKIEGTSNCLPFGASSTVLGKTTWNATVRGLWGRDPGGAPTHHWSHECRAVTVARDHLIVLDNARLWALAIEQPATVRPLAHRRLVPYWGDEGRLIGGWDLDASDAGFHCLVLSESDYGYGYQTSAKVEELTPDGRCDAGGVNTLTDVSEIGVGRMDASPEIVAGVDGRVFVSRWTSTNWNRGELPMPGATDVVILATRAYVTTIAGDLHTVDIEDPLRPAITNTLHLGSSAHRIRSDASHLYVSSSLGGLAVLQVDGPDNPTIVGSGTAGPPPDEFDVERGLAVGLWRGATMLVYDVKDSAAPALVASVPVDPPANDIAISEHMVYLAQRNSVGVFEVSHEREPHFVGDLEVGLRIEGVGAHDGLLYLLTPGGRDGFGGSVKVYPGHCSSFPTGTPPVTPHRALMERVYPNPFRSTTTFAHRFHPGDVVDVQVLDAAGRRVRSWSQPIEGTGGTSLSWNGLDGHGRPVAAGVYFVRLSTTREHVTHRVIRIR